MQDAKSQIWGFGNPPEMSLKKVRCSALPRILNCPASSKNPEILIDTASSAARIGNSVHAVLKNVLINNLDYIPKVEPICQANNCNEYDDVKIMSWLGLQALQTNLDYIYPQAIEETRWLVIDGKVVLTGTPDLTGTAYIDGKKYLVILDWKTGSDEIDPFYQLLGYAAMIADYVPDIEGVRLITCYLRLRDIDTKDVSLERLQEYKKEIIDAVESDRYDPQETSCRYCPMAHQCEAHSIKGREFTQFFLEAQSANELPVENFASIMEKVKFVEKKIREFKDFIKIHIAENGPIDLGNERELVLSEETRDTIYFDKKAYKFLRQYFGVNGERLLNELDGAVTLKKSSLNKLISSRAERGKKSEQINEVLDGLKECGSIFTTTFNKMQSQKKEANDG